MRTTLIALILILMTFWTPTVAFADIETVYTGPLDQMPGLNPNINEAEWVANNHTWDRYRAQVALRDLRVKHLGNAVVAEGMVDGVVSTLSKVEANPLHGLCFEVTDKRMNGKERTAALLCSAAIRFGGPAGILLGTIGRSVNLRNWVKRINGVH